LYRVTKPDELIQIKLHDYLLHVNGFQETFHRGKLCQVTLPALEALHKD